MTKYASNRSQTTLWHQEEGELKRKDTNMYNYNKQSN